MTFVQISSKDIEGPRTKLFIFFFSCVLRQYKREGRKQKGEGGNKEGLNFNSLVRCVDFLCIEMHKKWLGLVVVYGVAFCGRFRQIFERKFVVV